MSLRQKLEELLGQWDGSDALERNQQRQHLVSELMALMQNAGSGVEPPASACPGTKPKRSAA